MMLKLRLRRGAGGFAWLGWLALVVILLIWNYYLWNRLNTLDDRGRNLREWIGTVTGPAPDASGGLTTWLIDLKEELHDHVGEPAATAHERPPHSHNDPPPPPVW